MQGLQAPGAHTHVIFESLQLRGMFGLIEMYGERKGHTIQYIVVQAWHSDVPQITGAILEWIQYNLFRRAATP